MSDRSANDSTQTAQLLHRAELGDSRAVPELLARYQAYVGRLVSLRLDDHVRSRVDPSDVVQETHLAVIKRFADYLNRRPASFKIWLRSEVLQQLICIRRRHLEAEKRTVYKEVMLSDVSSLMIARSLLSATPSAIARKQEEANEVRAAIEELEESDREILLLRRVEELTNEEVAELLNVKPEAARKRYGRAIRRLAIRLRERGSRSLD